MAQDYMFSNYYTLFLKEINNSVGKRPGIMETNYFRINKYLYFFKLPT